MLPLVFSLRERMVHAKPFPRPEWELCSRLAAAAQGWVAPAAVRGGASSALRRTVWVGLARRGPSGKIARPASQGGELVPEDRCVLAALLDPGDVQGPQRSQLSRSRD